LTKILFLEDDPLFGETLVDLLEESSYEIEHFTNGQDALNATFDTKYDLYLLDINVPLIDGISLLRDLRNANDITPTIFLTSHKDKSMLEKGFLSGADDFITKPFDSDELLWRLTALLKRTQASVPKVLGKLSHDAEHKSISYDGVLLDLSKKEYDFLSLLMQHANENLPKELILDSLWRSGEGGSDGAIRVYINRIKTLLPELQIENIRGIGYKLVC
jgi:DNA-binding response OmpR family regulator